MSPRVRGGLEAADPFDMAPMGGDRLEKKNQSRAGSQVQGFLGGNLLKRRAQVCSHRRLPT